MTLPPLSTTVDESSSLLQSSLPSTLPSKSKITVFAALYVLSGCSQPLLMTACRDAGLADSTSQLYMLFYYLGPASVLLFPAQWLVSDKDDEKWPRWTTILKGCGIAWFDIGAQSLNYTGAALAGPTIFAIVYSSVTVWTAVFSRCCLYRSMNGWQALSVVLVFGGLTVTAKDASEPVVGGTNLVFHGLVLIFIGSMMHALTYVMSEGIMMHGTERSRSSDQRLTVRQNCAIQGMVAGASFFVWQLVYTLPRWEEKIAGPMHDAGTTLSQAIRIFAAFALANLIHGVTFFHTLKYFPGGATSAGVMKGLQAVLVFIVTDRFYCGRSGGAEMCFTPAKFVSLITVVGGVVGYAVSTKHPIATRAKRAEDLAVLPA